MNACNNKLLSCTFQWFLMLEQRACTKMHGELKTLVIKGLKALYIYVTRYIFTQFLWFGDKRL